MGGFGRSPYGRGPYGRSDLGSDLLVKTFPDNYFDDSIVLDAGETIRDNDKDPILHLLKVFAHCVNNRRVDVDTLPSLIDYESAPLEIVRLMGDMLGLGIDKNDPEFLQRSFLGNASQWLQVKSTKKGYQIRGLASGFEVSVDNFWRIDPSYAAFIPAYNLHVLKPKTADAGAVGILHTDSPPGTWAGTPTEEDSTYAKSTYLRIVLMVAEPRRNDVNYNTLLDLVIDKIKDVVGIHHEIHSIQFQILMPVSFDISFNFHWEEVCHQIDANEFDRFDIIPADMEICDRISSTVVINIPEAPSESSGGVSVGLSAGFTGGIHESVEIDLFMTSMSVQVEETMSMGIAVDMSAGGYVVADPFGSIDVVSSIEIQQHVTSIQDQTVAETVISFAYEESEIIRPVGMTISWGDDQFSEIIIPITVGVDAGMINADNIDISVNPNALGQADESVFASSSLSSTASFAQGEIFYASVFESIGNGVLIYSNLGMPITVGETVSGYTEFEDFGLNASGVVDVLSSVSGLIYEETVPSVSPIFTVSDSGGSESIGFKVYAFGSLDEGDLSVDEHGTVGYTIIDAYGSINVGASVSGIATIGGATTWGFGMDLAYQVEPMIYYFVDTGSSSNVDANLAYQAEPFITWKVD